MNSNANTDSTTDSNTNSNENINPSSQDSGTIADNQNNPGRDIDLTITIN